MIFTHIDACPDCFEKWLILSSDILEDVNEKKTHTGKVMYHKALSSWQFKSAVGFAFVVCLITPFYLSLKKPATINTNQIANESGGLDVVSSKPSDPTIYHKLFFKGYNAPPIENFPFLSDLGRRSAASLPHSAPSKDTLDNQFYQAGQIGRKILMRCNSEDTPVVYVSPKELKIVQAMRDQAPPSIHLLKQYAEQVEQLSFATNPHEQKNICSKLEDVVYTLLGKGH